MSKLLDFIFHHEQFRAARLPSLYSDFRNLSTTNPSGYQANIHAWKAVLTDAVRSGIIGEDKFILPAGDDLISRLQTPDWGRPLALGTVLGEGAYAKDFIPLSQFLAQRESIYHWTYTGALINWGLQRVGLSEPTRGMMKGKFVVIRNVEEIAKDIIRKMSMCTSRADRVYTSELFAQEFAPNISKTDLQVLIRYMGRDLGECVYDGKTLKFKYADEQPSAITEQDSTTAQLKSFLGKLNNRIDTLSADIVRCTNKAHIAVSQKNRTVALAALKSRKIAEAALAQQAKALGAVEEVLSSIQTAADNIELVQVLERSSNVLARLNNEIGGVDRVDMVMEALREEIETVEELNRILGETAPEVDEGIIEDELDALLQVEKEKPEGNKAIKELEVVPPAPYIIKDRDSQISDSLEVNSSSQREEQGRKETSTEKMPVI